MNLLKRLQVAVAAGFMLAPVGGAMGATDTGPSQADRAFVTKAAQAGMMEVAAGKLAAKRGLDPAVKDFGNKMVTDHTAAHAKLKALADSEQLLLPDSMSEEQSAALAKLEVLNGTDFDKTYSRMMVKDHGDNISEFEKEVQKGQDAQIKSFAQNTLPTLRQHLTLAEKLNSQEKR